MCDYEVTERTSPSFILYNLVFGAPRTKIINSENLFSELKEYDKVLDKRAIDASLTQWYRDGRLNEYKDGYILA